VKKKVEEKPIAHNFSFGHPSLLISCEAT
jgi:hypothetical protein